MQRPTVSRRQTESRGSTGSHETAEIPSKDKQATQVPRYGAATQQDLGGKSMDPQEVARFSPSLRAFLVLGGARAGSRPPRPRWGHHLRKAGSAVGSGRRLRRK